MSSEARTHPTDDVSRERLAAVARLYYLDELGQQDIAAIMGISRSQISRLLSRAREQGIVRITVDEYDPRDRDLERALRNELGLQLAVVVRGAERTDRSAEHVRRAIGYFAARAVADLVKPGLVVGLAGGRTLAALVAHLRAENGARHASGLRVVQLMGNTGPTATDIDAIDLCRTLAQRFGGTFYTVNAPAIAQDREARDLFLAHEHIRTVRDLFGSLGLALVGVGSLDESAFIDRGVLPAEVRARLREAGAVGEICGRFFDAEGRECSSPLRDRVVSIELDDLRRCPEVVAVTNGAQRAQAVRAALEGGLVRSLVTDDAGARALLA